MLTLPEEGQRLRPALATIGLIGVITTFGLPGWFWTFLIGALRRKIILRGLRICTTRLARTFWLGLHEMAELNDGTRGWFLDRVKARIARIPVQEGAMGQIGHWAVLTAPEFAALERTWAGSAQACPPIW